MRNILASCLAMMVLASTGVADAPEVSLRPMQRSAENVPLNLENPDELAEAILAVRKRPVQRPMSEQERAEALLDGTAAFASVDSSKRPWVRPDSVVEYAMAKRRLRRKGAVCGDIDLLGERVGLVPGKIKACGIRDAVRLRSVSGVGLSQQALINCDTAKALKKWVERGVQPAFGRRDPVVQLKVAAHYSCRTRNNQRGAKLSEHAKGNAIDISGFVLESGKVVTVLNDWNGRGSLRQVHKAACGPFGTVLGPNSDRYHRDHFHLDVARHRGGPFCR